MRIAVIGAGSAGITTAWLLQADHDVVCFEAGDHAGGHVHTAALEHEGERLDVELGTQFFFREGYSGMHALMGRLGVKAVPETLALSLTLADGRTTIVAPPLHRRALRTLIPRRTLRALYWFGRFAWAGEGVVRNGDWSVTVQQLMDRCGVPRDVADDFLIQLVASSWGVPCALARELSAYSVTRVMGVRATRLPHTHRLKGGLSSYIRAMVADSPRLDLRLNTPVEGVDRDERGLLVRVAGQSHPFDAAILACDWNNSAALCAAAPALADWHHAFAAFEDYEARVAVHRDVSLMPPNRHYWESSNHFFTKGPQPRNTVWSGKPLGAHIFRTWMYEGEAEPEGMSHFLRYRHIAMTTKHPARQAALAALQGQAGLWAAGMYTTGIDNHESAIRSGLRVAEALAPEAERVRWLAPQLSS